ncbi:MAG: SRPBCC family protein [Pseudomonadota bacterium]
MPGETAELAPGTNRDFSFTVATSAPDKVWRLWTTPSTWGNWDKGLKSASMAKEMALGPTGQTMPLSGPASQFEVTEFESQHSYSFLTRLPLAQLTVARSFNADRSEFTHRVRFSGPLAFVFARMFGTGFRKALLPTMRTLNAPAESS